MSRPSIHTPGFLVALAALLLCSIPIYADTPVDVSTMLSTQGTITSQTLNASTRTGTIDISAYDVRLDPTEGPIFVRSHTLSDMSAFVHSPRVLSAAVYDGMLVLAGRFDPVRGTYSRNIVGWNGNNWISIGHFGANGTIFELAVYNNRLVVAGDFSTVGNELISHIAYWDGRFFHPMAKGLDEPVFALTLFHDRLIAAGLNGLGSQYGLGCSGVIAWDGHRWTCEGLQIQGIVREIETTGDRLAATGQFFGHPIGRPDTTLYFDGHRWGATDMSHAGLASIGAAADAAK